VIPLPLAIPESVTVDSLTALLPLVTVNVTYAGTPAVTDVGVEATDNACAPVEVIAIDPPVKPVLFADAAIIPPRIKF
jgi:hypothetical protein